jgi:hypothetical protein
MSASNEAEGGTVLPAPPPPAGRPDAVPLSRFTPQRLVIFFGLLVGVASGYVLASELVLAVWIRRTAQQFVDLAMNAEVEHIERISITRDGEVVLHRVRVAIQAAEGKKLFYTSDEMRFALEGNVERFAEVGLRAVQDLRIRRVEIRRPHVYFRKDTEGRWNLDLAFSTTRRPRPDPSPGTPESPAPPLPDYFPPEGIHVVDATMHNVFYSEKGQELDWLVERVNLVVRKSRSGHLLLQSPAGESVIEGDFYGGKITAWVDLLDYRRMVEGNLQIKVLDADVARMTRSVELQRRMSGKLSAFLSLGRSAAETHGQLRGSGWISVTEGDLYDYPMVVSALTVLSFVAPGDNRITDAKARFALEKDHIRIMQLDFIGTSMSLFGSGECALNGDDLYVCLSPKLPGTLNPLNLALGIMGTALLEGSVINPTARYTTLAAVDPAIRRLIEETVGRGDK